MIILFDVGVPHGFLFAQEGLGIYPLLVPIRFVPRLFSCPSCDLW